MFKKTHTKSDGLSEIIDNVQNVLNETSPMSDDFPIIVDQLSKLYQIRNDSKSARSGISPDTLASIVGNLAGIAMIVEYERAHVVASKAIGFVSKLR